MELELRVGKRNFASIFHTNVNDGVRINLKSAASFSSKAAIICLPCALFLTTDLEFQMRNESV